MTGVYLVGSGKFACVVARYVRDAVRAGTADWTVCGFVDVDGGEPAVPRDRLVDPAEFAPGPGTAVLLATSDVELRRTFVTRFPDADYPDLVHPTSCVEDGQLTGGGTVVGPFCTVGADAVVGAFTTITNHGSVGNHSRIGSNNFLSPSFHCGNSVRMGDDNFFGLSCAVAPEVRIGDANVVSAGVTVFEDVADARTLISTARVKALPRTPQET